MKVKMNVQEIHIQIDKIGKDLEQLVPEIKKGAVAVLKDTTDAIGKDAQTYAPRDTGALEESMRTRVTELKRSVKGEVAFTTDYAMIQHEMFPIKRKKGQMKYLERAVTEHVFKFFADAQKMAQEVLARIFNGES